ncbi:hypothetical protein [Brucella tritici]|uniref:hypothetical protein n=1 Tax=Brucella tritici TaxID=94626 RepID=UPI003D6C7D88
MEIQAAILDEMVLVRLYCEKPAAQGQLDAERKLYRVERTLARHPSLPRPLPILFSDLIGLDDINASFDKLAEGAAVRRIIQFT